MKFIEDLKITTAESVTAGGISRELGHILPKSTTTRFVVYSDDAKRLLLGVSAELLKTEGAVCAEVAKQMALGALSKTGADYAIAVTGYAGGSGDKLRGIKAGTVFIAVAAQDKIPEVKEFHFTGNRTDDRTQTTREALGMLSSKLLADGYSALDIKGFEVSGHQNQGEQLDQVLIDRFGVKQVHESSRLLKECKDKSIKFSIVEKSTSGKIFNFLTSLSGSSEVFGAPGIIDADFSDMEFLYLKGSEDKINFILFSSDNELKLFKYTDEPVPLRMKSFDLNQEKPFQTVIDAVEYAHNKHTNVRSVQQLAGNQLANYI